MANCNPIAFTLDFFAPELNTIVLTRVLAIFEALNDGDIISEGSGLPIDMVTDHQNLQYFSMDQNPSCIDNTIGLNTFLDSIL